MPLSEQRSCLGLIEAPFVSFLVHITCQPDFFFFSFVSEAKESMHVRRVDALFWKRGESRKTKAGRLGWYFLQI